jgi:hypothetical protein
MRKIVIHNHLPKPTYDAVTKVVTPYQYKSNIESGKWVEVMAPSKAWFGASAQVKIDGVLTHLKIEGDVSSIVRDATDSEFQKKDRVRLKQVKPLPSGKSVSLVGMIDYLRPDGLYEVRIVTPGLYGGGIFKVRPDEIEKV